MFTLIMAGVCSMAVQGKEPPPVEAPFATIYEPAFTLEDVWIGKGQTYQPQAGDIVFATNPKAIQSIGHILANARHPHHSMIVFCRPDGTPAILEAGPHDTFRIQVREVIPHMASYAEGGLAWVRRRKTPLTPEQSAALTQFCMGAENKFFAEQRIGALMIHIGARGPLRTAVMGRVKYNRFSYYCTEVTATAMTYAGLLDEELVRPSAMYPRDLFFGETNNRWVQRGMRNVNCDWYAPARFSHKRPPDIDGPVAPGATLIVP